MPRTSTSCCPTASSNWATRRARPRKRNGKRVGGDPPTPGTSKRIVSIFFLPPFSSASMKGSNTSRLAPMPLISRSGGPLLSPRRMAAETCLPLTLIVLVSVAALLRTISCLLVHILAILLAQHFLVELAHAGPLQGVHKENVRYRPFGDGPALCNGFDMNLDVTLRDLIHVRFRQHDQRQQAL